MLLSRRGLLGTVAAGCAWPAGLAWAQDEAPVSELVIEALAPGVVGVNGSTPGPLLRWRQGQDVAIRVINHLNEPTSIHWHGVRVPNQMDGVPGLNFAAIAPGESFLYQFHVHQSGTYWYHSHYGGQEQIGLYGPIIVTPRAASPEKFDRDYVLMLSDQPVESPARIMAKLKFQSDAYDFAQPTLWDWLRGKTSAAEQLSWARMRMSPSDIADVSGATYRYWLNGKTARQNWSGLFTPGETLRLRFINAASMSLFDVRIPGLPIAVVAADGNEVEPVRVDEFRIAPGETYDAIVRPAARAYTIFAQSQDRSGYARGTLTPVAGASAPVPAMDPKPRRTMADMGQGMAMAGMAMNGMAMNGMASGNRLAEPGDGLAGNRRRVLVYTDLKARIAGADPRPPTREVTLHLSGDMRRYIWGFDGKKYSQSQPLALAYGERVRLILINDTMMDHPIHLHGLWSELENDYGEFRPYKHTIVVKPAERLSFLVTADARGQWAFHCHLLYHMEAGMFRVVEVA